jgi:hypothetical protein
MTPKEKELTEWFFNLVGYFNHYSFFIKELWRKVKGFKKYDEAEIKCAFMHYWFHHRFGYFTCACGCGWFTELDEESYNNYIERYKPVINAFEQWKMEQR